MEGNDYHSWTFLICAHLSFTALRQIWHKLYCESGGFAVLPDNPRVRSISQLIGKAEDLGRGPNNRAGELMHQSHSPHQPAWLQTQALKPYNSVLVAMQNLSNWALMIWFSLARCVCFSLYPPLLLIWLQASPSFPCLDVWSFALIPICCCHREVAPNSRAL